MRKEIPVAQISLILAESNRDRTKHPQPFKLEDFLIVNRKPKPEVSPEDKAKAMLAQVEYLNAVFGGNDLRKGATA
jgi:hypothetical protein